MTEVAERHRSSPRALDAVALVAFVALGLPDGVLGVAWPSIRADFDRSVPALGILLAAQTVGYLLATAANGALVGRLGTGRLLVSAAGLAVVGFISFTTTTSWLLLGIASLAVGTAAGMVDAGLNAHVAVHHGRRAMGLLHAAFGIGATAGPLLVTTMLAADRGWRSAYGFVAVLQGLLLGAFLLTRAHWRAAPADVPGTDAGGEVHPRLRGSLVLTMATFFVYTGFEISSGQWAFSLLTEERDFDATSAGLWVAAYWGALTVGRLVMAVAADLAGAATVLGWATAGALAGAILLWLDVLGTGVLGLPVIGLCLAPVFPTLVSLTPERLGTERAAHAIGYQLTAAGVGAAALPGAVAVLIGVGGLATLGPALVAMAVGLVVLNLVSQLVAGQKPC